MDFFRSVVDEDIFPDKKAAALEAAELLTGVESEFSPVFVISAPPEVSGFTNTESVVLI